MSTPKIIKKIGNSDHFPLSIELNLKEIKFLRLEKFSYI